MRHLTIDDILKATGGETLCAVRREFSGLSTDSRTIRDGDLFIALRGPRFDGHRFVGEAMKKAAGALIDTRPDPSLSGTFIRVKDTLKGLQDIARFRRRQSGVPAVGVVGTNGKTTTKELIASVLGLSHRVLKTEGNLNNHIGMPLSIGRMKGDETIMVLEMGSNVPGDIRLLCDIGRPDFAVVTNVGPAHLEGFGDIRTVRETDLEILDFVKAASVNADDLFLLEGFSRFGGRLVRYGIERDAEFSAREIAPQDTGTRFRLVYPGGDMTVSLAIPGRLNVYNALAAASVAFELGIEPLEIRDGLESFTGVPMRLEVRKIGGARVILDAYNANPASVEEGLKELARTKGARAIAVLGDMLELGAYTEEAHSGVVDKLNELGVDVLIAVGPEMAKASARFAGPCHIAEDSQRAGEILSGIYREGDSILIKGSRGMRMEKALPAGKDAQGVQNAL